MTGKDEFRLLLDACRRREATATADLVHRYLPHVRAAIRRRLATPLRGRFDSLDFAQEVWLSFFRAAINRPDLQDETALIGYLCEMARLKVAEEYRHQTTVRTGLTREVPLELSGDVASRGPTPSAGALADDEWEQLTAGLPERERKLLRMLREGHSHADVAKACGLSEKTIQRLVRKILDRENLPGSSP